MKHFASLIAGAIVGASFFVVGLYYNPFIAQPSVSPLAVTDARVVDLSFSAVPSEALLYTNNGEGTVEPFPARVAELWEPAIAETEIFVTQLQNSGGGPAGIGVKFLSKSEQTQLIQGKVLTNSVWHVVLPERGTFLIDQVENNWTYLRDVVIPARWSSGEGWRGTFHHIMTAGPGSLGTARVTGGSGIFAGTSSESVESLTARAYSASSGPATMHRNLTMALPDTRQAPDLQ